MACVEQTKIKFFKKIQVYFRSPLELSFCLFTAVSFKINDKGNEVKCPQLSSIIYDMLILRWRNTLWNLIDRTTIQSTNVTGETMFLEQDMSTSEERLLSDIKIIFKCHILEYFCVELQLKQLSNVYLDKPLKCVEV